MWKFSGRRYLFWKKKSISFCGMAELPEVGGRCKFSSCNRLDFLPFTCPLCKCCFCSDHRFTHGCDTSEQIGRGTHVTPSEPIQVFMCSLNGCSRAESIRIACPYCEKNYCLKHRHAEEHSCGDFRKMSNSRQLSSGSSATTSFVTQKPASKSEPKPLNQVERQKMDRMLIMKLKMNAQKTTDIPVEERTFLFVEGDVVGRQAVLVSQKWTIGRCASTIKRQLFPNVKRTARLCRFRVERFA